MIHTEGIQLHIFGLRHASYVPLDIRDIQAVLMRMLAYLGYGVTRTRLFSVDSLRGQGGDGFFEELERTDHEYIADCVDGNAVRIKNDLPSASADSLADIFGTPEQSTLSLRFVRDATIFTANAAHMHCASPTNILSFPLYTSAEGVLVPPLGDMLVSVDTVCREAFLYGQDSTEYTIRLLAHGMAHMVGHEHGEAMTMLEQAFLADIDLFL